MGRRPVLVLAAGAVLALPGGAAAQTQRVPVASGSLPAPPLPEPLRWQAVAVPQGLPGTAVLVDALDGAGRRLQSYAQPAIPATIRRERIVAAEIRPPRRPTRGLVVAGAVRPEVRRVVVTLRGGSRRSARTVAGAPDWRVTHRFFALGATVPAAAAGGRAVVRIDGFDARGRRVARVTRATLL